MTKVKELRIGDRFYFNNKKCVLVVREILKDRVQASKETSQYPHGIISESFYSSKFEDLQNRVELAS